MDYWYDVYRIRKYGDEPTEVEFSITNDKESKKLFFHFDLCNLNNVQRYKEMLERKKEFIIPYLYYPTEKFSEGFSYQCMCKLNNKTILDIRNQQNQKPYYAVIFIADRKPLLPNNLVIYMEYLIKSLFFQDISLQISIIPSYKKTIYSFTTKH